MAVLTAPRKSGSFPGLSAWITRMTNCVESAVYVTPPSEDTWRTKAVWRRPAPAASPHLYRHSISCSVEAVPAGTVPIAIVVRVAPVEWSTKAWSAISAPQRFRGASAMTRGRVSKVRPAPTGPRKGLGGRCPE